VVGVNKLPAWPTSDGIGNTGWAQVIQSTPDSIGYVDLAQVLKSGLAQAALLNRSGRYVVPSLETVAAAAAHSRRAGTTALSIVNDLGKNAYPIAFYSWVLLFKHPGEASAAALRSLFRWTVTTGQSYAASLGYVPLPKNIQKVAVSLLDEIR
jgi:phosphate transport system substrate-binding protein